MSIEISREIEDRLTAEARRQGITVEALIERLVSERAWTARVPGAPELPLWRLGGSGSLHRRDIYDDVR